MNFISSIKTCFKKYIDFNGRASRSEFWYFTLLLVFGYFGQWELGSHLTIIKEKKFGLI